MSTFGIFITALIISIMVGFLLNKYVLRDALKEVKDEIGSELLSEKDLPILKEIELIKDISIKLYDVKKIEYKREYDEVYNAPYHVYIKLAKIINEYTKIDFVERDNGLEADIELADFTLEENKFIYMEIIELVTNFNLAQFVFKGEDKFKLLNLDLDIVDQMKEHADDIISKTFKEVVESYCENDENGILG